MPQNITPAAPTDVMPKLISMAFNEQMRYESLINQDYPDGSSDRAPLVEFPRSFFRIAGKLMPSQWLALRNFFLSHKGIPFYFYFGRETEPPYTVDMTGGSTDGRYTVVFDGQYSENYSPGRAKGDTYFGQSQSTFQLREIE
ncbi:MAG TPA: hypothetical protein VGF16_16535 [Bryobacteraceae bacterium]|jgi:hypothetical protein